MRASRSRPTLDAMTDTRLLPRQDGAPLGSAQYSLTKILSIWASVTAPMAVLAIVVAPAVMARTPLHPGLVHWIFMVVGMAWQFVVSLAVLRHELGSLEKVRRVVKLLGMVNAVPEYGDQPKVVNGCSDLFVEVFGDKGRHARSAVGVGSLPLGVTVEVEAIVEVE